MENQDWNKKVLEAMREHIQREKTDPKYKKQGDEFERELREMGFFRLTNDTEED